MTPLTLIVGPAAKTTPTLVAELETAGVHIPGISNQPADPRRGLRLIHCAGTDVSRPSGKDAA